jgi:hypothetical protein
MRRIFKLLGVILGVVLVAVLVLVGFLVLDSGGSKDQTIKQAASPNGKLVAEIHQITTPMHGGPDTLTVTIRQAQDPIGQKVYSRTYECDDFSAFRIQWMAPSELTIMYGACNTSGINTIEEIIERIEFGRAIPCGAI